MPRVNTTVLVVQLGLAAIPFGLFGDWSILLVAAAGIVLSFLTGALPQWRSEKWACRSGTTKTVVLTRGNGSQHAIVVIGDGKGLDLEDLATAPTLSSPSRPSNVNILQNTNTTNGKQEPRVLCYSRGGNQEANPQHRKGSGGELGLDYDSSTANSKLTAGRDQSAPDRFPALRRGGLAFGVSANDHSDVLAVDLRSIGTKLESESESRICITF